MPRTRIQVQGVVQGVGFRPFVFRLANELSLEGWVQNRPEGVRIEVQGPGASLDAFHRRLQAEKPRAAALHGLRSEPMPEALDRAADGAPFRILSSASSTIGSMRAE